MYPYRIIALHSNWVKSNPICGSQDSNCGHTNRSVQVKRYIWQVSLFLKIAINCSDLIILSNFDQFVTPMWLWRTWRNFHFVTLQEGCDKVQILSDGANFGKNCPIRDICDKLLFCPGNLTFRNSTPRHPPHPHLAIRSGIILSPPSTIICIPCCASVHPSQR